MHDERHHVMPQDLCGMRVDLPEVDEGRAGLPQRQPHEGVLVDAVGQHPGGHHYEQRMVQHARVVPATAQILRSK